jgi:arginyl-tRNA--protein-N-Asp/Glu arginylyltransferase
MCKSHRLNRDQAIQHLLSLTALHDFSHALVLRQQGKSEQAEQMHRQGLRNYEKVLSNVQVQFDLARSMAKNRSMARSQLVLETMRGMRDVLESGLQLR